MSSETSLHPKSLSKANSAPPYWVRFFETLTYFLKLGTVGFGGPLSLVAMMEKELIEDRHWISQDEFKQAFVLIKSMPGPVAFQTAVFLGRKRAGRLGGLAAAMAIILPAFLMMLVYGYYYDLIKSNRSAQLFLAGMQVSAVVAILFGLKSFFLPYVRRIDYWLILISAALLFYYQVLPEPVLIIGGAALWAARRKLFSSNGKSGGVALSLFVMDPKFVDLVLVCAKAGAIVFGTGLAIVPILEHDFVSRLHWMTHAEFMDAVAIGQITPGPVMISATFIGFKIFGIKGALAATIAVFGPSFFHMMTWFNSAIQFLSRQKWIQEFVFAATSIIMGTLAVSTVAIMWPWHVTPWYYALFALIFALAANFKWPAWLLIPTGGLIAVVVGLFGLV